MRRSRFPKNVRPILAGRSGQRRSPRRSAKKSLAACKLDGDTIYDMREIILPGACDCHIHVVGSMDVFPQTASRSYTAAPATIQSLSEVAKPLGVTCFVVVQPSFYGTDNSCLLEALDRLGDSGRGVAVVDPKSTTPRELESFGRRGICGLRLNFFSSSVADPHRQLERSLAETLDILPRPGWHIEIIARAATLAAAAPVIAKVDLPIVVDHYGLPENEDPKGPIGRALLDLAALPHVWMKLSAPYRCSANVLSTTPPAEWLQAFLRAAPNRCVWGSDWPHTPPHKQGEVNQPYRNIAYGRLFGDFLGALASPEIARRILIDNPVKLFGFSQSQPYTSVAREDGAR